MPLSPNPILGAAVSAWLAAPSDEADVILEAALLGHRPSDWASGPEAVFFDSFEADHSERPLLGNSAVRVTLDDGHIWLVDEDGIWTDFTGMFG